MACTWGGATLPNYEAEGITVKPALVGAQSRALDGTLRQQYITRKRTITIPLKAVSAADHTTLLSTVSSNINTTATLVLPDSQSFTVLLAPDGYTEKQRSLAGSTIVYDIDLIFAEV